MILKKVCLLISIVFIFSCQKKNENNENLKTNLNFEAKKICELKINIEQIGEVQSFDFIDDNRFVVSIKNTNDIFIYDLDGNQINKINETGNGPNQYGQVSLVRVFDQKIYVWDSTRLNLFVYDIEGNAISKFSGLGRAIRDFVPNKDFILFYLAGGSENIVARYDILKDKYKYFGKVEEEHIVLSMNKYSGGITFFDNKLRYCSADNLSVNSYDFNDDSFTITSINDKEFTVEEVKDGINFVNSNRTEAIKYLMENSCVSGLYSTKDLLFIKADIGVLKYDNDSLDVSNRFQKFYVINREMKLKGIAKTNYSFSGDGIYASKDDNLYMLKFNYKDNVLAYELLKLEVS